MRKDITNFINKDGEFKSENINDIKLILNRRLATYNGNNSNVQLKIKK